MIETVVVTVPGQPVEVVEVGHGVTIPQGDARWLRQAEAPAIYAPIRFGDVMALEGDSRPAGAHHDTTATLRNNHMRYPAFWIRFFTRQRFHYDSTLNFAVGGSTCLEVYQRLRNGTIAAMRAAGVKVVLLQVDTNDRSPGNNYTLAKSIADYAAILDLLQGNGFNVIMIPSWPKGDSANLSNILPTTGLNQREINRQFRQWQVAEAARRPGVFAIDVWDDVVDPAFDDDRFKPNMTSDGVHPSANIAIIVAERMIELLAQYFPGQRYAIAEDSTDLYNGATNPYGVVSANPMFSGVSGGPLSGERSGQLADSWLAPQGLTTAGTTRVYSKQTLNGVNWQQVVLAGTPTHGQPQIELVRQDNMHLLFAEGETLEAFADVEFEGLQNVYDVALRVRFILPGSVNHDWVDGANYSNETGILPNRLYRGTYCARNIVVPAGATNGQLSIRTRGPSNQPLGLTFRVRSMGLRRQRP